MLAEARREIVPGLSSVEKKGPSNIECHTLLGGAFFTKQRHTRPGIFWSLTGPTCPLIIILSFLFLFLFFLRKNNNTLLVAPFLKIHDTIERGQDSFFFFFGKIGIIILIISNLNPNKSITRYRIRVKRKGLHNNKMRHYIGNK